MAATTTCGSPASTWAGRLARRPCAQSSRTANRDSTGTANSIRSPATDPTLAPGDGVALTTPVVAVAVAASHNRAAAVMNAAISGRRTGSDPPDGRSRGIIRRTRLPSGN